MGIHNDSHCTCELQSTTKAHKTWRAPRSQGHDCYTLNKSSRLCGFRLLWMCFLFRSPSVQVKLQLYKTFSKTFSTWSPSLPQHSWSCSGALQMAELSMESYWAGDRRRKIAFFFALDLAPHRSIHFRGLIGIWRNMPFRTGDTKNILNHFGIIWDMCWWSNTWNQIYR